MGHIQRLSAIIYPRVQRQTARPSLPWASSIPVPRFSQNFWSDLLQVGLRHIEDMVSLKLWIYIVLFALFLREQFVVLPLDVFLCFLIDHRKRGEHHGERMLTFQY